MIKNSLPSLSKYIAQSGHCSRRKATDLIKQGKVRINGTVTIEPFTPVQEHDLVVVENKQITASKKIYILLNKPKNVVCTVADEKDRRTVSDLFMAYFPERLYPIGRLDRATTGLLIMTNDGNLTHKLSHPKYGIEKTYKITSDYVISKKTVDQLLQGIQLEDGFMKVDAAFYPLETKKIVCVTIHSGKNQIVRRLFKALGYDDIKLDRCNYAGLTKTGLEIGDWRHLTKQEVFALTTKGTVTAEDSLVIDKAPKITKPAPAQETAKKVLPAFKKTESKKAKSVSQIAEDKKLEKLKQSALEHYTQSQKTYSQPYRSKEFITTKSIADRQERRHSSAKPTRTSTHAGSNPTQAQRSNYADRPGQTASVKSERERPVSRPSELLTPIKGKRQETYSRSKNTAPAKPLRDRKFNIKKETLKKGQSTEYVNTFSTKPKAVHNVATDKSMNKTALKISQAKKARKKESGYKKK